MNQGPVNDDETNNDEMNDDETDSAPVARDDLVEASLSNLRDHRDTAARWLAVEVLLSDEAALEDEDLAARLNALQDRLEAQTRLRYGVA